MYNAPFFHFGTLTFVEYTKPLVLHRRKYTICSLDDLVTKRICADCTNCNEEAALQDSHFNNNSCTIFFSYLSFLFSFSFFSFFL